VLPGKVSQSLPNLGNKCPLASPQTLSNFVALGQELCEISAGQNLCFPKSGSKFTKMTYYAQMPLIVPNFIALDQTMYEKSFTKIFYTFSILDLRGTLCATVHQSGPCCTARPPVWMCQISPRSENPSTRYPLPNFIDFVDSVTDKRQ